MRPCQAVTSCARCQHDPRGNGGLRLPVAGSNRHWRAPIGLELARAARNLARGKWEPSVPSGHELWHACAGTAWHASNRTAAEPRRSSNRAASRADVPGFRTAPNEGGPARREAPPQACSCHQ